MSIEANSDLHRRASLHGVLADVARLAIVDALALGDASPSELASLTGMPSNLLAHHLGVLESRGLILRRRSEGDRRRAYVQLVGDELADIGLTATATASRILFVCTANSARSQLAAALWRRVSGVPTASAGTHPAERIDRLAVETAARHRIRLRGLRPAHLESVQRPGDVIVCVCDQAYEELQVSGEVHATPLHWSIPDPVPVNTADAFERAFTEIDARVQRLAAAVPVP